MPARTPKREGKPYWQSDTAAAGRDGSDVRDTPSTVLLRVEPAAILSRLPKQMAFDAHDREPTATTRAKLAMLINCILDDFCNYATPKENLPNHTDSAAVTY